jgi:hypothetical protein
MARAPGGRNEKIAQTGVPEALYNNISRSLPGRDSSCTEGDELKTVVVPILMTQIQRNQAAFYRNCAGAVLTGKPIPTDIITGEYFFPPSKNIFLITFQERFYDQFSR